jgi:hypothetical protein
MNHVQPILSIVFSTIVKALKGEFYLNVMVVAGQAKHHGDLFVVGQLPWGRFLLFQPSQQFQPKIFQHPDFS